MKNKFGSFLLIAVFAAGLGILLYPYISNYVAQRNVAAGSVQYEQAIADMDRELLVKAWQEAERYNDNLRGDPLHDPFVPGSGVALPENYLSVLNMGDSIMGYINIPGIGVYLPIRHGTSDEVLSRGVGHVEQTALPIGSVGGHPVLTAHTGYTTSELFTKLTEVAQGDKFYLYIMDRTLTYQVDNIAVILPEEIDTLRAVAGQDYVTLVTCTPYGVNSHRLLVRGIRIPNDEATKHTNAQPVIPWNIIFISSGCLLMLLLVILTSRRSR